MPFTHHSHSGQFCGHAKDTLEAVVQEAIAQQMEVLCLTEHMPRDHEPDLYPEEVEAGITPAQLRKTFEAYLQEAHRLQSLYKDRLTILIGMETDWIRPATCRVTIEGLLRSPYPPLDLFVGSVHHVHTIPIDFSQDLYDKAIQFALDNAKATPSDSVLVGQGEAQLVADYFDLQLNMLETLEPPVVGHFDLIKLYSYYEKEGTSLSQWPAVWQKVKRNLAFIAGYGGCLEINSAAVRKGLREPYPSRDICQAFLEVGGKFVLSDDSHGIAQVGHSYLKVLDLAEQAGIQSVQVFVKTTGQTQTQTNTETLHQKHRLHAAALRAVPLQDLRHSAFVRRLAAPK